MYEVESTIISSINNRVYANQTKRNDKCRHSGLLDKCEIIARKFWKFLDVVESRYCDNPYHNKYHSCDIVSVHYLFQDKFLRRQHCMAS